MNLYVPTPENIAKEQVALRLERDALRKENEVLRSRLAAEQMFGVPFGVGWNHNIHGGPEPTAADEMVLPAMPPIDYQELQRAAHVFHMTRYLSLFPRFYIAETNWPVWSMPETLLIDNRIPAGCCSSPSERIAGCQDAGPVPIIG